MNPGPGTASGGGPILNYELPLVESVNRLPIVKGETGIPGTQTQVKCGLRRRPQCKGPWAVPLSCDLCSLHIGFLMI